MRLQMLLPEAEASALKKMSEDIRTHHLAKIQKYKDDARAKLMVAAQRNDQAKIAAFNKGALELDVQRMYITHTNLVRAAVALGLKEMSKLSNDKVIELARKHGVSRGRPNVAE